MAIHEEVAGEEKEVMSDLIELRTWLDVVAEKDAEIERLKDELESIAFHTGLETARLRAALEEIWNLKIGEFHRAPLIARKALEGK